MEDSSYNPEFKGDDREGYQDIGEVTTVIDDIFLDTESSQMDKKLEPIEETAGKEKGDSVDAESGQKDEKPESIEVPAGQDGGNPDDTEDVTPIEEDAGKDKEAGKSVEVEKNKNKRVFGKGIATGIGIATAAILVVGGVGWLLNKNSAPTEDKAKQTTEAPQDNSQEDTEQTTEAPQNNPNINMGIVPEVLSLDNIDSVELEAGKYYKATGNFDGEQKEIDFTMGGKFEQDQLVTNALKGYNTEADKYNSQNERSKRNTVSFGERQYDKSIDLNSMSEQELKELMHKGYDEGLDRIASGEEAVATAFFAMEYGYKWGNDTVDTVQEANKLLNDGMLKDPETEYSVRCFVVKEMVKDSMEHNIQTVFYGPNEGYQSYFASRQNQTDENIYYGKCNTNAGKDGILGYSIDGDSDGDADRTTSLVCFQPIEHGTDPTGISMEEAELIYTSGVEGDYRITAGNEGDGGTAGNESDPGSAGTEYDGKTAFVVDQPTNPMPVTVEQPVNPAPDRQDQISVDVTDNTIEETPPSVENPTEDHYEEGNEGWHGDEEQSEQGAPEVPEEPTERETEVGSGEFTGSADDIDLG